MTRSRSIVFLLMLFMVVSKSFAQGGESPLKVFGYFQTSFQQWTAFDDRPEQNSFSLQQLNLFFQKNLARHWSAFINFEILNSFSSSRQWGALNLEEAWVKYRLNEKFTLKLGLQIPIFNNLNLIKNKTPVLPYIIRPLVYETSFNEFLAIEEFVPSRAFAQAYGFLPSGKTKFEYAVYLGNTPNINNDRAKGQTGVDTTTAFLFGGRLGIRYRELKLGLSGTYEKRNEFIGLAEDLGRSPSDLRELPTTRLGGDLSYNVAKFSLEGEFITVNMGKDIPELELDLDFYYLTLGYQFTDELFVYGSYWVTKSHFAALTEVAGITEDEKDLVPNIGLSYNINDRIRLKGQYARVKVDGTDRQIPQDTVIKVEENFNVYAIAASVFF